MAGVKQTSSSPRPRRRRRNVTQAAALAVLLLCSHCPAPASGDTAVSNASAQKPAAAPMATPQPQHQFVRSTSTIKLVKRVRTSTVASAGPSALSSLLPPSAASSSNRGRAMPPRFCEPLPHRPVVFFHMRKTGGSALRQELYKEAMARNYTVSIPCITSHCHTGHVMVRDWSTQVLAGHFVWGHVFSNLPYRQADITQLTCVTVFREPTERLRSCFYFYWPRLVDFSELSPQQMIRLLSQVRNTYGEGCVNEPVRIFSGFTSEAELNQLHKRPGLQAALVEVSKHHLSQCVVLLQEELRGPNTAAILRHWLPWLNHTGAQENVNAIKPPLEVLSAEQLTALRTVAGAEYELYEWAKARYQEQLAYLIESEHEPCIR